MNILSKLLNLKEFPRYTKELPYYIRGTASARTIWGDRIVVPFPEFRSIVDHGILLGHGEEKVFEYLNAHLSEKDIFFDIGANAGFYSLLAAHKGAQVHAFEPFPSVVALLVKNTKGKSIMVHSEAVSDINGRVCMEKGKRPGLNHVSANGTIEVSSIKLDDAQITPTVMKVDVEGHEMNVFRGAQNLLTHHHPIIIAEVNAESRDYLISLGYTATLLGKTNYLFTK
jgi:FkbM family methyltransferase